MSTIIRKLTSTVAAAALVLGIVALPGCGGGGYGGYGPSYVGTLEVENDPFSFFDIDAFEVQAGLGPVEHYDVGLAPGDLFSVDFTPDDYDVEVFWSDGSSELFFVSVLDGYTTTITGIN